MKFRPSISAVSWMIAAIIGFSAMTVPAESPQSRSPNTTLLYFLRHAEDVPEMDDFDPSFTVLYTQCTDACCTEALNPLGQARAGALAGWFAENRIAPTLTHVIASHKLRTRQTVQPIALAAGLGGDLDGDGTLDGADVDQVSGDGVINIPPTPAECDPDWASGASVVQPQIEYISMLPLGSRAVVCSHSPAVYPIMEAFGIDTSDPVKFPKKPNGKVLGFNNLWIVALEPVQVGDSVVYDGRLLEHIVLDLKLGVSAIHRDPGYQRGRAIRTGR